MNEWITLIVDLGAVLAPVIGALVVAWRYLDTRNRELLEAKNKRYAVTIRELSGERSDGSKTFLVENIAAIYRLLEFPEKRELSIMLIEESLKKSDWADGLAHHAGLVISKLRCRD